MRSAALVALLLLAAAPAQGRPSARASAPAHAALDAASINAAAPPAKPITSGKQPQAAVIKAQVLLDRAGFSPGEISGRLDENTGKAIANFETAHDLVADGKLSGDAWNALTATSDKPVLGDYAISAEDVKGPFLQKLPTRMEEMKDLSALSYTSPREALAEKFHMSEALLAALNPGKHFEEAGTMIVVANVAADARPQAKVTRIEVDKPQHLLRAYGRVGEDAKASGTGCRGQQSAPGRNSKPGSSCAADETLIAVFPASIGSPEKPAPSGTFKITSVTQDPTYRYDPAYAFKGVKTQKPFTIRPGPNNPVGVVWIGLSAKGGYGIHGTPNPDNVGKTASHGCIRLTNWDIEKLAAMVGKGVPVEFLD